MFGPFQFAASISTRVVPSLTSERMPPITPAIEVGPSASSITSMPRVERPLDLVQRGHLLAVARAPHDQRAARHQVGVERVQRLPAEQHHVVGDVDDVGDRPLAGRHQPRLQPRRRLAELHVLVQHGGEARAQLAVLHPDREARDLVARRAARRSGSGVSSAPGRGVDLARDPVDGQAVRPVRRDLELEHVGGERQHLLERRPRQEVVVEDHDPLVQGADADLVLGQDHPVGLDAPQLRLLELHAARHHRARPRDRHGLALGDVRRPAHDLRGVALAQRDHADGQPVGVGMLLGRTAPGRRRSSRARSRRACTCARRRSRSSSGAPRARRRPARGRSNR